MAFVKDHDIHQPRRPISSAEGKQGVAVGDDLPPFFRGETWLFEFRKAQAMTEEPGSDVVDRHAAANALEIDARVAPETGAKAKKYDCSA
jgi:hypothetical protein